MTRPTQQEMAEHLDLSKRQIQRLVADGIIDPRTDLDTIRVAYIRFIRSAACGPRQTNRTAPTEILPGSLEAEKLRLTRAQAEAQELKNEIARGEAAPIELLERVLTACAAEAAGILDSLPLTIKRKHPQLDSQIIESIKRQTVKAMNAIAQSEVNIDRVVQEYTASLSGL